VTISFNFVCNVLVISRWWFRDESVVLIILTDSLRTHSGLTTESLKSKFFKKVQKRSKGAKEIIVSK